MKISLKEDYFVNRGTTEKGDVDARDKSCIRRKTRIISGVENHCGKETEINE